MFKTLFSCLTLCAAVTAMSAQPLQAAMTTSPYLFTDQAAASSGQFEWDEISSSVFAPISPDVSSVGIGAGSLSLDFTAQPMDGPPVPLLSGTDNIYVGGTLVDFDINVTGLSTTEANTTVVLQVSVIGSLNLNSILLDGNTPTNLVDRHVASDVFHNTDNGSGGEAHDTHFYWAEWQVTAESNYLLEFSNTATHQSFTQARVDYFNTTTAFSAVAAANVPEPATLLMACLGACFALATNRRC